MALLLSVCEVLTYALNMCEAGSLNRSTELSSNNVINLLEQTEAEQKREKRLCLDNVPFLRHRISYIYSEPDMWSSLQRSSPNLSKPYYVVYKLR